LICIDSAGLAGQPDPLLDSDDRSALFISSRLIIAPQSAKIDRLEWAKPPTLFSILA